VRWRRSLGVASAVNWPIVVPVVGGTLGAVGLAMAVCALTAVVAGDGATVAFALPAAVVLPLAAAGLLSGGCGRSRSGRATASWP
jgi:hypothetical protein